MTKREAEKIKEMIKESSIKIFTNSWILVDHVIRVCDVEYILDLYTRDDEESKILTNKKDDYTELSFGGVSETKAENVDR